MARSRACGERGRFERTRTDVPISTYDVAFPHYRGSVKIVGLRWLQGKERGVTELVRFCSEDGRQWRVRLHRQAPVAEFLIFESAGERRVLLDPPSDWERQLAELFHEAVRMENAPA